MGLPRSETHLSLSAQSHSLMHGRPCQGCSTGHSHVHPPLTTASPTARPGRRARGAAQPCPIDMHKDRLPRTRSQGVSPTELPAPVPSCRSACPRHPLRPCSDGAPQDAHTPTQGRQAKGREMGRGGHRRRGSKGSPERTGLYTLPEAYAVGPRMCARVRFQSSPNSL